jgi:hypothetical protein
MERKRSRASGVQLQSRFLVRVERPAMRVGSGGNI